MEATTKFIGERIKYFRKESSMTLEQLSQKSSITVNYLSQVEKGAANISIGKLESICKSLNIHISQVIPSNKLESFLDNQTFLVLKEALSHPETKEILINVLNLTLKLRKTKES